MFLQNYSPEYLKSVFNGTRILRKPITGIISGYHDLPYIVVGPDEKSDQRSIEIKGQINVSPKIILSPHPTETSYGDVFEQDQEEFMEKQICGRIFTFICARKYNDNLKNHKFQVNQRDIKPMDLLDRVMEELERAEIINTGVIFAPVAKLYPISIDRFINDILDKEFGV